MFSLLTFCSISLYAGDDTKKIKDKKKQTVESSQSKEAKVIAALEYQFPGGAPLVDSPINDTKQSIPSSTREEFFSRCQGR